MTVNDAIETPWDLAVKALNRELMLFLLTRKRPGDSFVLGKFDKKVTDELLALVLTKRDAYLFRELVRHCVDLDTSRNPRALSLRNLAFNDDIEPLRNAIGYQRPVRISSVKIFEVSDGPSSIEEEGPSTRLNYRYA